MNTTLRNTLAVVAGFIGGSAVNMSLIMLGGVMVPPPVGVDPTNMESLKAGMHLFEFKHFIFPFLAHALGTLMGVFIATRLAVSHKYKIAMGIGIVFLAGGVTNVILLPSPVWFAALDLIAAYIPMAFLGYKLANSRAPQNETAAPSHTLEN